MISPALSHQWPGATLKTNPANARSAAEALRLRERRLMEYMTKRRSERWMTEEAAAAERHPTLLEDNPSSG